MLTIRACERLGIKTVLVTYEYGGKEGVDSPLLFYAAEANAVVSAGSRDRWIDLPAPQRVVGPYEAIRVLSYPGAPSSPAGITTRALSATVAHRASGRAIDRAPCGSS